MTERFDSIIASMGSIHLPDFAGVRVMMMPFLWEAPEETLPDSMRQWRRPLREICAHSSVTGVGYLTIDEAAVKSGETHRRPGLHVDGMGAYGGGGYAKSGMFVGASRMAARGWHKIFEGAPGEDGDCAHLGSQCSRKEATYFLGGKLYYCSPFCVHEALPLTQDVERTFLRVSMPSDAPWHEGYTPNPLGIMPGGPILGARAEQMAFRA